MNESDEIVCDDRYPYKYRAIVEACDDPELRGRYRVRIPVLHDDSFPVENLPWAEVCSAYSGRGFGDVPGFDKGDRVWVSFENGDPAHPVVDGAWTSRREGVNDRVPENTNNFKENRFRWARVSRTGNTLVLSDVPSELHVQIKSGKAAITVSQVDDSVVVDTKGPVRIQAGNSAILVKQHYEQADDVFTLAKGNPGLLDVGKFLGLDTAPGRIREIANGRGTFCGVKETMLGYSLPTNALGLPVKSKHTLVLGERVTVGQDFPDLLKRLFPTFEVVVQSSLKTTVKSLGAVDISAPVVNITAVGAVNVAAPVVKVTTARMEVGPA